MSIFDQTRQLLKSLKTRASSVANVLPPVAGYNAVRQMATPQFRQQAQNIANWGSSLSQRGAQAGQQLGRRIQQTPQIPTLDPRTFVAKKIAPTVLGMAGSAPGEFVRGLAQTTREVAEPSRFLKAPLYNKGNILGTPQAPTKAGIAFDAVTSLPDITDVGKLAVVGGFGAGVLKSQLDAKALKPFLSEIRNVSKMLGNMDEIPYLTPEQLKAAESIVSKIRGRNAVAQLNKLNPNAKDYLNSLRVLLSGAEDQILNPGINIGFTTKAVKTPRATKGVESVPVKTDTKLYLKELVQKQKAASDGGKVGVVQKAKSFLSDIKAKLVDETSPIEDILTSAESKYKFNVLPKDDVRLQIDRVLRSNNIAGQFAKDNGLVDVIKNAPDLDALDQYMIAKQASRVSGMGKKTGRDALKDQQLIQDLAPEYEQLAQTVNQYSRKLLDYSVQNGLIPSNLAKELTKKYPDYVPLQRIFNELEMPNVRGTGKGKVSLSSQSVVQNLKGSEREIASPIESLLLKTQDAISQGERNVAARQLAGYKDLPGFEGLIKEVKEGSKAPHTFSFLDNGVKRTFATTPEIEAAAKSLNVEQMGLIGKIVSIPTRLLQLGATGLNIPFVVTNMVKDELTAFVNSSKAVQTSILNPANYLKSLLSAVKHDELYDEVIRNAAGGTSFDIARSAPDLTVQKLRSGRNLASKIKYTVTKPSELIRAVEDLIGRSEELGRIKNYKGTYDALIKEGRTAQDAALLGAKAARGNTANFARRGSWGRVLNWVIPYFNAGIQGARQLVSSARTRPIQTGAKVATTIFTPIAAVTAWNLSDPERKKVYDDIAPYEKENNLVIVPPNPTQDTKGRWNVIKIPLPPGLSNLGSIIRRGIESANGLDPIKFGEIASNLIAAGTSIDVSSPNKTLSSLTPQLLKAPIETATNTNLFTGNKIVPEYMKGKLPEEQVKATTSKGAIAIGKALNTSPLLVENAVQSSLGGLGSQLLGKESIAGNIQRRFSKATGGVKLDKIYDDSEKLATVESRAKKLLEQGKKEEALSLVRSNAELIKRRAVIKEQKSKVDDLYQMRNKVLADTRLTQEQKDRVLLLIRKKLTEVSNNY